MYAPFENLKAAIGYEITCLKYAVNDVDSGLIHELFSAMTKNTPYANTFWGLNFRFQIIPTSALSLNACRCFSRSRIRFFNSRTLFNSCSVMTCRLPLLMFNAVALLGLFGIIPARHIPHEVAGYSANSFKFRVMSCPG